MKHDWEYKKLGEICDIINGLWTGKKPPFVKVGVIRNTNFTKSCTLDDSDIFYTDVEEKAYSKRKLQKGDIIIEKSGGSEKQPVGRPILFGLDGEYSFSNFTSTLRINNGSIIPSFLHKVLVGLYFQGKTRPLQSKTTGLHNLDFNKYLRFSIPVPPLPIQQQIVDELDKLSEIIEKKKQQVKELDTLAQSIFYDMFGDPVENEKGWDVKDINDICSLIVRGPFGSALKKEFFVKPDNSTYKVYEQKHAINKSVDIGEYHISKEKYAELKRFEVFPKDIIMSCSGTIGELYQIPNDAPKGIMNQALLKFTLNKLVCPSVFLFLMGFIKNNMVVHGCGLQNIGSVKELKLIKFGLPPLPLQQSFAQKIEAIEKQKELINQSIKEAQTLFDSRMDYYFGE